MIGVRVEESDRPPHERVVVLARAVRGIGVRQVGDAEQEVAQRSLDLVVLGGEGTFGVAEGSALVLARLGGVDVSRPTECADLLGDGIHPGPDVVTLLRDRTQPRIEIGGVAHVVEQSGAVSATECFLDHRQVGAQESLVDHDVAGYLSAIIPVRPVPRPVTLR